MKYFILNFLILFTLSAYSQDNAKFLEIEMELDRLAEETPQLNEKINISVNGVSIQDFLRGIANNAGINVTVDPFIDVKVVNNFSQVQVKDIFVFLCKQYNLDITVTGNIFTFSQKIKQIDKPLNIKPKNIIDYDDTLDLLTLDVKSDSLVNVSREIVNKTGKNIIIAPGLSNNIVSGFIMKMQFEKGLENFAFANNLLITKTADNIYIIEKVLTTAENESQPSVKQEIAKTKKNTIRNNKFNDDNLIIIKSIDSISAFVKKMPISELISYVSDSLSVNYFYMSDIQGDVSLNVANIPYNKFLEFALNATQYTYKEQKGIYIIGDKKAAELKAVKVLKLQYRPVLKILESLPSDLTKELDIKEFSELNAFLVMGPQIAIANFEEFIFQIDKVIPVVLIEVIIVDINKTKSISTGIDMGFGDKNNIAASQGSMMPSFNMQVGTRTLNEIADGFNGFGLINLGKIAPSFYLKIKAMEDQGLVKIRSTPKLSTLNGHEASLKSGETKFYKEEQNSYYGSQIPQMAKSYTWKPINADLSVIIKPTVSGDEQITLEIEVQQSEFTQKETIEAPPGSVTRTFKSLIRVKNQETVLLGGLEKESTNNTTSGFPILSRIPVLKWIFGNNSRKNDNAKLNIFIKPTLIY